MKKLLFLFLIFSSCSSSIHQLFIRSYNIPYANDIMANELYYRIKTLSLTNCILVDLRPTQDYCKAHISNSISIPYNKIYKITNINNYQDKKIIFYDQEKVKPFFSRTLAKKYQITNVLFLLTGFKYWNYPIEKNNITNLSQQNLINREPYEL